MMKTHDLFRRDRQSGQALMFTVVALVVTSAIGLAAVTSVIRSLADEARLQKQAVVDRLAESASEEVFGRLSKSVLSLNAITTHPGYSTGTDVGTASSVWVRYGTDGQVVTCTNGTQACFTVRLAAHGFTAAGVATADVDSATSAVIQVTARQCRDDITSAQVVGRSASGADGTATCVYARRQTSIRSRLFSDHLIWVNTMANTKFATGDSIAGSIHLGTSNESFTFCGTPTIAKDTSVSPNVSYRIETLASTVVAVATSCTSTGSQVVSALTTASSDALALPVVSAADYEAIANATISTAVTSPAAIVLSGGNFTLNGGSSTAIPSSGVLYVSGPATISQTTSLTGKLTIAASGDIAITSSLELTSQVDDMLSIVSTAGNINIGFSAASRTIEALLIAPSLTAGQGIVRTTAANLSSATTTFPLNLFGAIVARELGALGTITALTGATTAGYSKSFTYDPRLATSQPPFAISQVRGRWIRLAATTVSPMTPGVKGIATTTTAANTAPTVAYTAPATPSASRTLSYTVTFSERISGLTSSDFSNTGTATSCTFSLPISYGITFTLTVVCSSDGTVIVRLAANSVIDNLGLTGPTSASSASTVTISSVATALAMETQPVGGENPTTFATDAKVKLVNSSGDLVTTTGTTITVTASGGTLTGTTSMTTTGGFAEFTNLTLTAAAGTYTLTFASTGLTSVTSAGFTVTVTAAATTAPVAFCVNTSTTTAITGISVGGLADGSTYLVSVALLNGPSGANLRITSNTGVTAKFGYSVAINTNFTSTVFTGLLADVNAVLATLRYVGSTAAASSTTIKVTASLENASFVLNATNGHFYFLNTNILNFTTATTGARDAAKAMSFQGQTGYLTTITSQAEDDFIKDNVSSAATNIWIGATDELVEGAWKWDTSGGSPEAGKQFWTGTSSGTCSLNNAFLGDGLNYACWASNEPNNSGNEDYAIINFNARNGLWNDLAAGSGGGRASVVEFGTNAPDNGYTTGSSTYSSATISLAPGDCESVTSLADTNTSGTLRYALGQANGSASINSIIVSSATTGTITLTSNLPAITQSVEIHGTGRDTTTIDGNSLYRAITNTTNAITITVKDLTFTRGKNEEGGILNTISETTPTTFNITNVKFNNSSGTAWFQQNKTVTTFTNCLFTSLATGIGSDYGNTPANLTFTDTGYDNRIYIFFSTFTSNTTAISTERFTKIENSTFTSNTSMAASLNGRNRQQVLNSTFTGNGTAVSLTSSIEPVDTRTNSLGFQMVKGNTFTSNTTAINFANLFSDGSTNRTTAVAGHSNQFSTSVNNTFTSNTTNISGSGFATS